MLPRGAGKRYAVYIYHLVAWTQHLLLLATANRVHLEHAHTKVLR